MVAAPIPRSGEYAQMQTNSSIILPAPASETKSQDWTNWVAASAVVAGGALMVTGNRRAGLAIAAAGTALALIEEQDAVATFWENLPHYLTQAQGFIDQIEQYMAEASVQGKRIQSILRS